MCSKVLCKTDFLYFIGQQFDIKQYFEIVEKLKKICRFFKNTYKIV